MINYGRRLGCISLTVILMTVGCTKQSESVTELKSYPITNLEGIINKTDVVFDNQISSDNNGSLRITVNQPATIRLYETGDLDIENARLIYKAKLRTEDVEGNVYLEMWCQFHGKGEYFSRAMRSALTGTTDWTVQQTPFFLKTGENPDNVKLNLVINGKGSAWIDDIQLLRASLQ